MAVHSSLSAALRKGIDVGRWGLARSRRSKTYQQWSIEFKSGLCAGQSITGNYWSCNHSAIGHAVWTGCSIVLKDAIAIPELLFNSVKQESVWNINVGLCRDSANTTTRDARCKTPPRKTRSRHNITASVSGCFWSHSARGRSARRFFWLIDWFISDSGASTTNDIFSP